MISIVIPVKRLIYTKSRLSSLLSKEERVNLSLYLLEDLLDLISTLDLFDVIVVGSDDEVKTVANRFNARFIRDESVGVNEAVKLAYDYLKESKASLVIPIDLVLLEPTDLIMLYETSKEIEQGIIIVPSDRLDGTNILLRKPSLVMDTYYDMDSYLLHIEKALDLGLEVRILLNDRIRYDLDSFADIKRIISINTNKKSIAYLKDLLLNRDFTLL